jgi:hypothetical protein
MHPALSKAPGVRATVTSWNIGDDEIGSELSGSTRVLFRRLIERWFRRRFAFASPSCACVGPDAHIETDVGGET